MVDSMHGYLRSDGRIGIRNSIAVIYTCLQVRHVAEQIANGIPRAQAFGSGESSSTVHLPDIIELSKHPNFAAAVIVGLNEDDEQAGPLADEILKTGKPSALIQVLPDGGTVKAALKGIRVGNVLARQADDGQRVPISLSDLVIGVICDDPAGMENAAHPAIEWVINWIAKRRGTVVCCGLPELVTVKETLPFGKKPPAPGLYQAENSSFGALLASGAHLIVLVSGYGSVTGSIAAPVIKVCGNSEVYRRLCDDMDIDAGQAADGAEATFETGRHILGRLVDIASGEPSKAEVLQHKEYYG